MLSHQKSDWAKPMTQSSRQRRNTRSTIWALIFFCLMVSGAGAQHRISASTSAQSGLVKIPVTDNQDIRFTHVSVNNVRIQTFTWSIAQDQYGFLWFGTVDGLFRHDGYNLKTYRHDTSNPNSLSESFIRFVYRDRSGMLWIATISGGLDKLDPAKDTFTHYRHDPANQQSLSNNDVYCAYQESGGVLWVGTGDGLDRLDPATGTFSHYKHDARDAGSLSSSRVTTIFEDRQGNLWIGTDSGLNKLNRDTGGFSRFLHDPANPRTLGHDSVGSILEDQSGVLWVGSELVGGLSALDVKSGEFTRYSFHSAQPGSQSVAGVTHIYEDRDGVLWLGTLDTGLLKLNRERKQVMRYASQPTNPNSLHDNAVKTIFEDAEGVIWVGTQEGVSRFLRKQLPFFNYRHEPGNPHSLHDNTIRSVHGDSKGFLWIGTKLGLNRLDRRTGQVTSYLLDSKSGDSLLGNRVAAIREGRTGELWIGTYYGGGLNRFDPATGRSVTYRHDPKNPDSLSNDVVLSLLFDRQGVLWAGTDGGGLNRFDSTTGRFRAYRNDPNNPQSLSDKIRTIFEDRAGILWLATFAGLNRFDPKTEQFTVYRHDPQNSRSLSHNSVNAIREDRQGLLWVGTRYGLNQLDRSRGAFTVFTTKDGLPDDRIQAILEDGQGYLWLATHSGLSRFHPPTKTFRNYSEADGLPGKILSPYEAESSWQGQDGEMVIGSMNGVTTFYPELLSPNPYVPPVVLTDFHLFNKPVQPGTDSPLHKPIWATDSLTLTHTQSIFTLEFAGLSYAAPEKNKYRYRLEGLEKEWNEVDSGRRQATYTSLPAGRYVFRVQASNNDEGWNKEGVSLALTVLPPWWRTWWFRSGMGLAFVGLILGTYKLRVRRLEQREEQLDALVQQRTAELRATTAELLEADEELKIAKEKAEEARRRIVQITDNVPCVVFEFEKMRDGTARAPFVSGGMEALIGVSAAEVMKDVGHYFATVLPEDAAAYVADIDRSAATVSDHRYTVRIRHAVSGKIRWLYIDAPAPRVDAEGNALWRGYLQDVTEQKRLEEEQRDSQQRFRALVSATASLVWETTADGEVEDLPEWRAYTGLSVEEVRGWGWLNALHPDDRARIGEAWQKAIDSLGLYETEYRIRRKDGAYLWHLARGIPILDPNGSIRMWVGSCLDIDARRRAEEELQVAKDVAEEATAMKSMFLANMSHEIRTPMNAVIGLAYLALKTPLTEKQRDYLNKIHNAGTSLLGVINDILDFSKIEAGRLDIETVDFRLDDVIGSVTTITAQKAQEKGLEFLAEVPNSVPQNLVGDPLRLGQVISNLINNAIKFTERGEVHLKAELLEQVGARARLRFSVKDSGIGMTPEQAARLFQPFSQADASTTRKHGGTGLGLTICRRLVELMGGEIGLESEPGAGSTFWFTVSVGEASGPARSRVIPEQLRAVSALVVDDNAAARDILVNALDGICAQVDAVSSGKDAIAAVKQHDSGRPYDVIFMDWRMPGLDGIEAARLIKQDPGLKKHPAVVLVTAFGREEVREEAEIVQLDGFLLKPVTQSMLVDVLVTLFAGSREDRLAPASDHRVDRLRGVRILLAEDNEINQQIAVELLEGVGATVDVANNGLEAVHKMLDQAATSNFDVVLMDIQMPEMDGYQATRKIRSDPRFANFPIIAMTAHATLEERQKCLEAGLNDHISKPIDPSVLFETLEPFVTEAMRSRVAAQPQPAPATVAEANELPEVAGLNMAQGLVRVAGNKKLYRKLLRQFSSTEADAAQRIASALAEKDRALAERLAHTVKGVAGNIGAGAVQNAAAHLEKSIKGSAPEAEIEEARVSLEQSLAPLIQGLQTALERADETTPAADPGQLKVAVEQLSRYLAESNAGAIDYFESAAPHLRTLFSATEFERFASLIENYAFSEAYEQLMAAGEQNALTPKI